MCDRSTLGVARFCSRSGSREELYIELENLDLADERAILSFVNRYGILGVGAYDFSAFASYRPFSHVREQLLAGIEVVNRQEGIEETLDEFRFGARCVKDLVAAWRLLNGIDTTPPTWESVPAGTSLRWEGLPGIPELNGGIESEAQTILTTLLSAGLKVFHPSVVEGERDAEKVQGLPWTSAPLYSICCLELYNHIVDNAPYRRCQNEPCGRFFVRQHGRARHGQHRMSGVIYCSRSCARAQATRAYRRKKATQPSGPTRPPS